MGEVGRPAVIMRLLAWVFLGLAATSTLVPGALADPMASIYFGPGGERCYIFWSDSDPPEYWVETNGVATGGVPEGNPATGFTGAYSGLHRIAHPNWGAADSKLTEPEWRHACHL